MTGVFPVVSQNVMLISPYVMIGTVSMLLNVSIFFTHSGIQVELSVTVSCDSFLNAFQLHLSKALAYMSLRLPLFSVPNFGP
jgi:hypothetical protein